MTEYKAHAHIARAMQLLSFGNDVCPICMMDIGPGDDVIQGHADDDPHTFHRECIYKYIANINTPRANKNKCPLCRKKLFVGDQLDLIAPRVGATDEDRRIRRILEDAERVAAPQPVAPAQTVHTRVSPARLIAMMQHAMSRHRFNDCDWSGLRIMAPQGGLHLHQRMHMFSECIFNCNMNTSRISSVVFRDCKFAYQQPTRSNIVIPSMIEATVVSSVFVRTYFGNMNVSNSTFDQCQFHEIRAYTHLARCTFSNGEMHLATWKGSFEKAVFKKMRLNNFKIENLEGWDVRTLSTLMNCCGTTWQECTVTDSQFNGIRMKRSTFEGCTFTNCHFIKTDMQDCTFQKCVFINCNFEEAQMQGLTAYASGRSEMNTFVRCYFRLANLSNANFTHSSLTSCHFSNRYFDEMDRVPIRYDNHRLKGASFRNCEISNCGFLDNNLTHVDFTSAVISHTPMMAQYRFTDEQKRQGNFSLATFDGVKQTSKMTTATKYISDDDDTEREEIQKAIRADEPIYISDNDDTEEKAIQEAIRASLDQDASSSSRGKKRKRIDPDSDDSDND